MDIRVLLSGTAATFVCVSYLSAGVHLPKTFASVISPSGTSTLPPVIPIRKPIIPQQPTPTPTKAPVIQQRPTPTKAPVTQQQPTPKKPPIAKKVVQPKWKVFTPPDRSFTILMPGKPTIVIQAQKTYMGVIRLKVFVAQPPQQEVAYVVTYNDFPYNYAQMNSPQKILNQAESTAVKTTQSKLVSQRDISNDGYPGKEIRYVNAGGKITINRMYVADGRLYQVMAIVSKKQSKTLAKTLVGYLNSFHLVL